MVRATATENTSKSNSDVIVECDYDDALDLTGFGKYNAAMLVSCSLLILGMYIDMFSFSVALPAIACDMSLNITQQGVLSSVPLIGVMISSYAWGLCADTLGRRLTLLLSMPIGVILSLAAGVAPTYASIVALKFFSTSFTSSATAAAFVLLGETTPQRHRNQFVFLAASAAMFVQFVTCIFALPVFNLTFDVYLPWASLHYRPWRLLVQVINLPVIIGLLGMIFLHESPKFLLSKGRHKDSLETLKKIHSFNARENEDKFTVTSVFLKESAVYVHPDTTFIRKMWNQTAPLFKPPLLKNSIKLYFLLLSGFMISTGYTAWIPTMTNAYFKGEDNWGKTFCEVAGTSSNITASADCDSVIEPFTLYAVASYSGVSGSLNVILSFVVGTVDNKKITMLVFTVSAVSGFALIFVRVPLLSIALFFCFNYVAIVLGPVNTYLVEFNPTYLRGMAICLSIVFARGFGFLSVQLIGSLMENHCTPMISGYVAFVTSGLIVSCFLPSDRTHNNVLPDYDENKNNETAKTRF